jgi:hypothetical protein
MSLSVSNCLHSLKCAVPLNSSVCHKQPYRLGLTNELALVLIPAIQAFSACVQFIQCPWSYFQMLKDYVKRQPFRNIFV